MKRIDIENKYKWSIDEMFDENKFKDDIDKLKVLSNEFERFKGVLESQDKIFEAFKKRDLISSLLEDLYCYSRMKLDEETTLSKSQTDIQLIGQLISEVSAKMSFFEPELLSQGVDMLESLKAEQKFVDYNHYLDDLIRQSKHFLSPEQEYVLASLSEVLNSPSDIYDMIHDADMKFGKIKISDNEELELTNSNYSRFLMNENEEIRKQAFEKMHTSFGKQKNTISTTFSSNIKKMIAISKLRGYDSALQMSLYDDNVPVEVYHNLIDSVKSKKSLLQKFVNLKSKSIEKPIMHYHDVYMPFVKEYDSDINYEDGFDMMLKGLKPLGDEYVSILEKARDERWIDVYSTQNKRSGAYSFGTYTSKPFILLNYQNKLNDVSTLAHELGHSVHSYYSRKYQPYSKADYSLFVAEVASTVNETILIQHMINNSEDKLEKKFLLGQFLEQFKGTLFRQVMFADFEREVYRKTESGEPLNAESYCKIYANLNKEYFGKSLEYSEKIENEWMRIPHFYSPFYVYKYSTSYCAAIAISTRIINSDADALDKYLEFLKLGGSLYPIDALKSAGVDLTTTKPIELALDFLEDLLSQFEELL